MATLWRPVRRSGFRLDSTRSANRQVQSWVAPMLKGGEYLFGKFQLGAPLSLDINPSITQRESAKALGVSQGETNFCLKELIGKGWLELECWPKTPCK